jgi:DNA modification methylase
MAKGKVMRQNAEKSLELNEYLVDLFTNKGDLVVDLFAGTASMGLACIKLERMYFGCEKDVPLHQAAKLRLMRAAEVASRKDYTAMIKNSISLPKSLLAQVSISVWLVLCFFVFFAFFC